MMITVEQQRVPEKSVSRGKETRSRENESCSKVSAPCVTTFNIGLAPEFGSHHDEHR